MECEWQQDGSLTMFSSTPGFVESVWFSQASNFEPFTPSFGDGTAIPDDDVEAMVSQLVSPQLQLVTPQNTRNLPLLVIARSFSERLLVVNSTRRCGRTQWPLIGRWAMCCAWTMRCVCMAGFRSLVTGQCSAASLRSELRVEALGRREVSSQAAAVACVLSACAVVQLFSFSFSTSSPLLPLLLLLLLLLVLHSCVILSLSRSVVPPPPSYY